VIVEKSGHHIQDDAPEVVLAAVREVVSDVRGGPTRAALDVAVKH
jgi:hypothetical protein